MAERKKIFYAFSLYTFLTSHYPSTSKGYKDNGFARSMRTRDTGLLKKYRDFFKSIENLFSFSHYPLLVEGYYLSFILFYILTRSGNKNKSSFTYYTFFCNKTLSLTGIEPMFSP